MKINKNKLFLFDFWFFIGLIINIFIFTIINNINDWSNVIIESIQVYSRYLLVGYNILKSIFGGIFLLKAIHKREIFLSKNIVFSISNLMYVGILIFILISYQFSLSDSDIYYNITICGLNITTFHLYILAVIKVCINMFGIPMWFIFLFSECQINNNMKRTLNIITRIIIIFYNLLIIFGLTND
jgi:hypothetical protein